MTRTDAALAGSIRIGFGVVSLVGNGGARLDVGSESEGQFEIAGITGFAAGQMKGSGRP